ncbi:hypothetical protein [Sphingomonas sp.]|uniref:hypothetical protein n=1 Tax=Sphingomonas sp. TaxID=28214 RepID=UPI002DD6A705|nr:hypothetical protein [Sphingomonas sp.]
MADLRLPILALICASAPVVAVDAQQRAPTKRAPRDIDPGITQTFTVRQSLVIRVPRLPAGRSPTAMALAPLPSMRWVEKKADKCLPVESLAAATVTEAESVDLLLNGGKRLRARFGSECKALDFYSGFYVKMPADGRVCAGRDSIRARSGGECRIKSFRTLVPER